MVIQVKTWEEVIGSEGQVRRTQTPRAPIIASPRSGQTRERPPTARRPTAAPARRSATPKAPVATQLTQDFLQLHNRCMAMVNYLLEKGDKEAQAYAWVVRKMLAQLHEDTRKNLKLGKKGTPGWCRSEYVRVLNRLALVTGQSKNYGFGSAETHKVILDGIKKANEDPEVTLKKLIANYEKAK